MSSPDLSRRLGRHRLTEELPHSGMLAAYHAVHDDSGAVRLRVLEADSMPGEAAIAQLRADAAIAQRAELAGIARVVEFSVVEPIHVSSVAIQGVSLSALATVLPAGRLSADATAGLGLELAETLAAAHEAGLIHAGLSPESVFVTTDGGVCITDVAIARFLTNLLADHSSVLGEMVGSMSPEQLSGSVEVSAATDVFSLGVLLYRACTGREPFEAPSAFGMSLRLTTGVADPIDPDGALPEPLAETIMAMLSVAPDQRPEVGDLCDQLRRSAPRDDGWRRALREAVVAAGGEPAASSPPPAPRPAARPAVPDAATRPPDPYPSPPASAPEPIPAPSFPSFAAADEAPTTVDPEAIGAGLTPSRPSPAEPEAREMLDYHPTIVDQAPVGDSDVVAMLRADLDGFAEAPVPKTLVLKNPGNPNPIRTSTPRPTARLRPAPQVAPVPDAGPPREPVSLGLIAAFALALFLIGVIVAFGIYAIAVT